MHSLVQMLMLWGFAFVTLSLAVVVLNIFHGVVGDDLVLRPLRQEAMLAAIASLIEGASLWVVVAVLPAASRALILPALIVALIYKVSHLEDWTRIDLLLLLGVQVAIGFFVASVYGGHFQAAALIAVAAGAFLAILAFFAREI